MHRKQLKRRGCLGHQQRGPGMGRGGLGAVVREAPWKRSHQAKTWNRACGGRVGKPSWQRKQHVPRPRGENKSAEQQEGQAACRWGKAGRHGHVGSPGHSNEQADGFTGASLLRNPPSPPPPTQTEAPQCLVQSKSDLSTASLTWTSRLSLPLVDTGRGATCSRGIVWTPRLSSPLPGPILLPPPSHPLSSVLTTSLSPALRRPAPPEASPGSTTSSSSSCWALPPWAQTAAPITSRPDRPRENRGARSGDAAGPRLQANQVSLPGIKGGLPQVAAGSSQLRAFVSMPCWRSRHLRGTSANENAAPTSSCAHSTLPPAGQRSSGCGKAPR